MKLRSFIKSRIENRKSGKHDFQSLLVTAQPIALMSRRGAVFAPQQPAPPQKDCLGGKSPPCNDKPEQLPAIFNFRS
jgi:hypothetical protein